MNRELVWIRHGMTLGNQKKRYIGGATDEALCEAGKQELERKRAQGLYPEVSLVLVSPMKRCLETAAILYPNTRRQIVEGFRECDFGLFENKNYEELAGVAAYQRWVDSGGLLPFPGGESREGFLERTLRTLKEVLLTKELPRRIALVVHGGTIMSALSLLDEAQNPFYSYHVENGEGYLCDCRWEGAQGKLSFFHCIRLDGKQTDGCK